MGCETATGFLKWLPGAGGSSVKAPVGQTQVESVAMSRSCFISMTIVSEFDFKVKADWMPKGCCKPNT